MLRTFTTSLCLAGLLALAGCSAEVSESSGAEMSGSQPVGAEPAGAQSMEVGCYGCIFGAEDASGCELAVRLEGTPYRVEGPFPNAHALGLCDAAGEAKVVGELQDGKFVASAFSMQ